MSETKLLVHYTLKISFDLNLESWILNIFESFSKLRVFCLEFSVYREGESKNSTAMHINRNCINKNSATSLLIKLGSNI